MNTQDKKILKTVLILVAVMLTILGLFLNKITTPRFLSSIELKINGYVLLNTNKDGSRKDSENIFNSHDNKQWSVVINDESQREIITGLLASLKNPMKSDTKIVLLNNEVDAKLSRQLPDRDDIIAVINDDNKLSGYFKAPFDNNKMVLTYSSVFTHR